MRHWILAAMFAASLTGCLNNEDVASGNTVPSSGETPNKWIVLAGDDRACPCTTGRPFYLVNRGSAPRSITFTERWSDVLGSQGEQTRGMPEVHEGWNGRKFLQCSPAHSSRGPDCAVTYSWVVDGVRFNHARRASFPTAGSAPVKNAESSSQERVDAGAVRLIEGATAADQSAADCVKLCARGDSNCLRASMASGGKDPTAEFVHLVETHRSSGLVPVDKLLEALGQKDNVCERTGLTINGSLVTNTGIACGWTAGEGTPFQVTAIIPGTLSGVMGSASQPLHVTFPKAELFGPSLHFADPALDRKFGGSIQSLQKASLISGGSERPFIVLSGSDHCVALQSD